MTRPRTLSELAEEARTKASGSEVSGTDTALRRAMREDIDAYIQALLNATDPFYVAPPEGWTPPKPTRRQRATAFAWRLRGWLAVPFVWVLRWLYPSALDRGDQ